MKSNIRGMFTLPELAIVGLAFVLVGFYLLPMGIQMLEGASPLSAVRGGRATFEVKDDGTQRTGEAALQADVSTDRTTTLSLVNAYKKDTSVAYKSYWYVNDVYKEVDSNTAGPSVDTAYTDTVIDVMVINGTTETYSYGNVVRDITPPLGSNQLIEVPLCEEDGSMSVRIWNDDNGNLNSGTDAEGIAASDDVTLDADYRAAADKCWGGPDADTMALLCFDYNTTEYDNVDETYNDDESAVIPNHLLSTVESCWNIPVTRDNDKVPFEIRLDVASSADADGVGSNVTLYFVDKDYYKHTETKEISGPSTNDNDNTQLGFADITATLYTS